MLARTLLVSLSLFVLVQPASAQDIAQRRQQYAVLARNLVPGLSDGTPAEEVSLEPAALEAKERWRVITLEGLETPDRRIRGVAKEAAEAHAKILDLASETSDSGIFVDLALALAMQNPLPLVRTLARENDKATNRDAKYGAAVQRRRSATFLLPELAREIAGDARKEPPLDIDFDENWFGERLPDRVNLTNVSDLDLTNCTVQIDIRGREGRWVRNVHFVPTWAKGKKLWADYMGNDPTVLSAISGTSATEVQDLAVSLWCDELRAEGLALHYPGKGRDSDRMKQLDKLMVMSIDYVAEPFFEDGPCIGITLAGVRQLPACKLTVLCHGGNRVDQILEQTLRGWSNGQRFSLQSRGALNRCPDSVDVSVQLDGAQQVWTKNFKVSSQR